MSSFPDSLFTPVLAIDNRIVSVLGSFRAIQPQYEGVHEMGTRTFQEKKSALPDANWAGLFKLGGVGAVIGGVLTVLDIMVYVVSPQPANIEGWFALFQRNWLVGLLDMDLLGMAIYIIVIPAIVALYISLRRGSQAWSAVATVLTFVGMAAYFASNTGVSMISLSNQYAAATTDAQRAMFLAAGEAAISTFFGPAFTTSFFLVTIALLIIAVVMLRSEVFSKKTAWIGIIAGVAGLGEQVPALGLLILVIALVNAVGLGIWFVLIGRRLLQMSSSGLPT